MSDPRVEAALRILSAHQGSSYDAMAAAIAAADAADPEVNVVTAFKVAAFTMRLEKEAEAAAKSLAILLADIQMMHRAADKLRKSLAPAPGDAA